MILPNTRLIDLTWGEVLQDLNTRYGRKAEGGHLPSNPVINEFMNVTECSLLTGYSPGYLRQLVFKRAIPYHKNPKLRPIRFKRLEIIEWMAGKKNEPIGDMADAYFNAKDDFKRQKSKP